MTDAVTMACRSLRTALLIRHRHMIFKSWILWLTISLGIGAAWHTSISHSDLRAEDHRVFDAVTARRSLCTQIMLAVLFTTYMTTSPMHMALDAPLSADVLVLVLNLRSIVGSGFIVNLPTVLCMFPFSCCRPSRSRTWFSQQHL